MNISFSTINPSEAKKRFEHSGFDYLNQPAKDFVIANLLKLNEFGKEIGSGCRVQCTVMYPSPQIEFHGDDAEKIYREVLSLMSVSETTTTAMVETQKKGWDE